MLRRSFLQAAAGAALRAAAPAPPPMNVVFVLMDDLGGRDTGPFGNRFIDTPNLDRFASESVRFTNAYAACPVCSPTRASIMTGQYPARLHLTDWIPGRKRFPTAPLLIPAFEQKLPANATTLAEALRTRGYRSAAVGKWHLGGTGSLPTDRGFDVNIAGTEKGSPPTYFGPLQLPGLSLGEGEFLTERLADEGGRFIANNRERPFFLYQSHFTVHIPLQARAEAIAKYRARPIGDVDPIYCAMVESADEAFGRTLRSIDDSGARDRTIVIFFSDNGGVRFQNSRKTIITDNSPLRAGKGHLFEGGIREPLLIRWPGVGRAVVDTPVSSVDFFPTVVPGARVDGVSLEPLVRGRRIAERPLFWHYPHYSDQGGLPSGAVRLAEWKLIEFYEDGRLELFHLGDDPGEKRNLVKREPGRVKKLHRLLGDWRRSVNATMPAKNPGHVPGNDREGLTGYEAPTPEA
jgi:arylsulfatase A